MIFKNSAYNPLKDISLLNLDSDSDLIALFKLLELGGITTESIEEKVIVLKLIKEMRICSGS